jgi:two-component system response regulator CpxR
MAQLRGSVLLIEDDKEFAALMSSYLSQHGYDIDPVHSGRTGLSRALLGRYDLIILDIMLPHLSGMEVLRQLRRRSRVPVIILTALAAQEARIAGLQAGADDYLCKPFAPEELLERMRAVLRRSGHPISLQSEVIQVRGIRLNPGTREADRGGVRIELTSAEFGLLDILMRSAGRVVSRDEFASVLYQRETTPYERALDVHISHLRKKLEKPGETLISAVRGVGYVFKAES